MSAPLKIFCCYAHQDQDLLIELIKRLKLLQSQDLITIWSDMDINPGDENKKVLDSHLEEADIILLLVSPDLGLTEMQLALQRQVENSAIVIPILLRPTPWQQMPIAHLHMIPTRAWPITKWENRDEAFNDITTHINRVIMSRKIASDAGTVNYINSGNTQLTPQTSLSGPSHTWGVRRWITITISLFLVLALTISTFFVIEANLPDSKTSIKTPIAQGSPLPVLSPTSVSPVPASPTPSPLIPLSPTPTQPRPVSPTPSLIFPGNPVVDDPMSGPNQNTDWDVSTQSYLSCNFVQGVYQLQAPANAGGGCGTNSAKAIVQNFICEIQMTIAQGIDNQQSGAGIIFRFNTQTMDGYALSFRQNGSYLLYYSTPNATIAKTLGAGTSQTFHQGANQTNRIDIRMVGSTIDIFVNGTYLTSATDDQVTEGNIGVQLGSGSDAATVDFSNLKIWTL